MKSIICSLALLLACYITSYAQCGKQVVLTGSQTTYLDTNGTVQRTVDEKSVIHINQSEAVIQVNDEQKMMLIIKSNTCNWDIPFKQGKTLLKGTMSREAGDTTNVTINIEGKAGKIILLFTMEGRPVVIKVGIDTFEEDH